jgi:GYF domain 2/Domain of unknown function (DUF4190)
MGEATWYTRSRGRIFGPFTRAQLESLRDRGQLTRFHEVSQDRQSWTSAASVSELFSQGEATPSQSPSNAYSLAGREIPVHEAQEMPTVGASALADGSSSWFYSRGGAHAGPVTFHDLQRMAAQGEIGPDSLIWKSGMADWVASRQFPDLVFPGQGAVTSVSAVPPQTYPAPSVPAYSNLPPRTSGLAVASLVLGILNLCGIGSLLATIFGAVSLGQIARSNGTLTGKGMAIAGLVLGIIGLGFVPFLYFLGLLGGIADSLQHRF